MMLLHIPLLLLSVVPIPPAVPESAVCRLARKYEQSDFQAASGCAMRPIDRSCTASVAGQTFYGSASLCESPLTGVLQGLCKATAALPQEITIHCVQEPFGPAWEETLDTTTGQIR